MKNADNPNELVILSEFGNIATARKFAESEELGQMQRAGVAEKTDIYFFEKAASKNIE